MVAREADKLSAQVAVLGSLLIEPRLVGQALERIRPEDFLTPKCRMVFQAIQALFAEGKPTDAVTVRSRLGGREGDGWTQYLMELMELTPTASNIWEYASIMRAQARKARRNELARMLMEAEDDEQEQKYMNQLNALRVDRRGWICPRCSWPLPSGTAASRWLT